MNESKIKEPEVVDTIKALITSCGANADSPDAALVTEQIQTSLRLLFEGHDRGQIKLMTRALKEMRYAYSIFNLYSGVRRISIFGSARTKEDHPDYQTCKMLSSELAARGWMVITGAAAGIMQAGLEGASRESSFGLSIRLPYEAGNDSVIYGDIKLINFNYFFTRKLMFLSHSHASAVFPGGVGTQDELFECLTLMQTGKTQIVPLVLLEGPGSSYWNMWQQYLAKNIEDRGFVDREDRFLYYHAPSVSAAVDHITHFYRRFHSYRYVKDHLVIRLNQPLLPYQVESLNEQFQSLVKEGKIEQRGPFDEESDFRELPRLSFAHTRRHFSRLRVLIDCINNFAE